MTDAVEVVNYQFIWMVADATHSQNDLAAPVTGVGAFARDLEEHHAVLVTTLP